MGGMVALAAIVAVLLLGVFPAFGTGIDERVVRGAALRWFEGGPFYNEYQLAGPYANRIGDVLYPPVALWLFVPFALLPAQLWYAIPAAIVAWSLWRMRPAWWAWPVMLALMAWPWSLGFWLFGNPTIWAVAFLFLGVQWAGPAVLILFKPVLFPWALWGIRHRAWWVWLGAFAVASLPFLPMWFDYLAVVTNARGMGYLVASVPLLLVPLVAWLGSRDHAHVLGAVAIPVARSSEGQQQARVVVEGPDTREARRRPAQ
jgi:hypothetical protein